MKKKLGLNTIMSAVHLIFVLSIVCSAICCLTLGILALPALTAVFGTGRAVLFGQYDIYDSVIKNFFAGLKREMRMMRYFPLQLFVMLQTAGMFAVEKTGMEILFVPMLACAAFLITLLIYIMTYHVFYSELPRVTDVLIAMFYRVQYFVIIWVIALLSVMYFGTAFAAVLFFAGVIVIFILEATSFLGIIAFKKLNSALTDEDKKHISEEILNKI